MNSRQRKIYIDDCPPFVTKDTSTIREILAPRNSILRSQSLAEATVVIGGSTDEHYHASSEEIYFIVKGYGKMCVGDEQFAVKAGDAVALLPGERHKIWNSGDTELVFLCMCAPSYEHNDTVITEK